MVGSGVGLGGKVAEEIVGGSFVAGAGLSGFGEAAEVTGVDGLGAGVWLPALGSGGADVQAATIAARISADSILATIRRTAE
jgi:hypothetical protein